MQLRFHDCEIDSECFELRRKGGLTSLEPKVFDVLLYLLENRDRVVTKQELLDALWPGEAVSDSVLPRCIAAMRRALGDTRTKQKTIATIHGRGYRFIAEVDSASAPSSDAPAETSTLTDPVKSTSAPSDFVGRADALERLESALARSREGAGAIRFVVGEPGIGKTRIVEEFAATATAAGFVQRVGNCYEGEGAPAFWPWLQVLRETIEATQDESELRKLVGTTGADLLELVPELGERLPDLKSPTGPDGEQAQFRLFDAVTRFLISVAKKHPLLIVLDDLHWADASSLGLLRFMVAQMGSAPILLVATYRDVDVRRGHPLADLLGVLARDVRCDRIALGGFTFEEIEALIERLTGKTPTDQLVKAMADMTEGNPFFLREIVFLLRDQGALDDVEAAHFGSMQLPQGVRDAIGRRLDGLSSECNDMLRSASVIGRHFRLSLVAAVNEPSEEDSMEALFELLAEALEAGLINESGRNQYSFSHALTRQTLYEELRAPQHILLHRRVGEAIERDLDPGRPRDERVSELAHHFFEAAAGENVEKAVAYSREAAEVCHRKHAYDEAVMYHERALEVSALDSGLDQHVRAELLLSLGAALHTSGRRDQGLETLSQATNIAREAEDWEVVARALLVIRGTGELGSTPRPGIVELIRETLDHLEPDAFRLRSQLMSRLTHSSHMTMEERIQMTDTALDWARHSGDNEALRDALSARWWAILGPERIDERMEVVQALHALASKSGDLRTRLLALEYEFGIHIIRGDRARVEESLLQFEDCANELRQPVYIFLAMSFRASWYIHCGRFAEAEELVEESYEYGLGVVPFAEMTSRGQRYWSKSNRGVPKKDLPDSAELVGLLQTSLIQNTIRQLFITILNFSNDRDAAAAMTRLSELDYRGLERDEHWMMLMTSLADIATSVGDSEMCQWLHGQLRPFTHLISVHDSMRVGRGSVAFAVGILAVALGDLDDAVEQFETAIERERGADMRHALVMSHLGLAGALARRGRPEDSDRATGLIQFARDEGRRLGLGAASPVMNFLDSKDPENPFDSSLWRRIQPS